MNLASPCVVALAALCLVACRRQPPAPAVTPGARLGGIDFARYCADTGGGTPTVAGDWVCDQNGARRPTDANDACRRQYPDANAHAEVERRGDPMSWACYAGVEGELGGLDLDRFCRAQGADRSAANEAGLWQCVTAAGPVRDVDMQAACAAQYPATRGVRARQLRPGNPTSWVCVAGS